MPAPALDATAQAELVRTGEATPLELVEAAIERIERLNGPLNAVITPLYEEARAAAPADGPFRGVPFLLKDLGAALAGMPSYWGNRVLRQLDRRLPADTAIGRRFAGAGFVVLGKTNTPEFGLQPTTQPLAFGPTRNPWDLDRSPGGSSGGSAAAVASGMVAAASGGDAGGSIRMPASWCAVVGLKPSRGRTSGGAVIRRTVVQFVLTRSVRDTAAILDAVHGSEPGDLFLAPPPERSYADELSDGPGRLRVGLLTAVDAVPDVHSACAAAADAAARLLESLGHVVEATGPERLYDDEFVHVWNVAATCGLRRLLDHFGEEAGRRLGADDVEPYTWARVTRPPEFSAAELLAAEEWTQLYALRLARWWDDGFDLLVTPATGEPPARLEELAPPPDDPLAIQPRFRRIWCFAAPFNATGQPALSLPLGWTDDGHPIGVQLVAAFGREDLLVRVAAQLEQSAPWAERLPPLHA